MVSQRYSRSVEELRISLREYMETLREGDDRLAVERDRRYAEVAAERLRSAEIRHDADQRALDLAREIQAYKDEKANDLRAQIESERGHYVSREEMNGVVEKLDAVIKPLTVYVTAQQGGPRAITSGMLIAGLGAVAGLLGILIVVANFLAAQ